METEATMTSEPIQIERARSRILKQAGLGECLRSARESMRLSEKDVAARLHLSPKMISIMENEDFENGPPATFMRGYLRSYARMMNISEVEINATIAKLEANATYTPVTNTIPILKTHSLHNKSHRYFRWMTYGVVSILVVLVSIWWSTHPKDFALTRTTHTSPIKNSASPTPITQAPRIATQITTSGSSNASQPTAPTVPAATPSPVPGVASVNTVAPDNTAAPISKALPKAPEMDMALPEPGLESSDTNDE